MSFDLPLWSMTEAAATLYQKDAQRFHLLLTEPQVVSHAAIQMSGAAAACGAPPAPRLLWLEISPYRLIMTMQGNGQFSYRHFWEQGVYGLSRYWLQGDGQYGHSQMRLRNFTRSLTVTGDTLPQHIRLEYELWSNQLRLGHYVMNLDIQP